ncbi:MAG: S1 RNA-binding domain-containing protein [Potamolinea sp.]
MNSKSTRSQSSNSSFSMDDFAKALEQHDYEFKKGNVVRGKVYNYENDGAYVDIGAKSLAYIPIDEVSTQLSGNWSDLLPLRQEMDFLIIQEQDADGQITVSRRQLEIKRTWDEVAQLQEDKKSVQVRVESVNKGGVTVDFKGLRGFIPRSHLSERNDLDSLVNQNLTVTFLEADSERKKLVFSQREASRSAGFSQLELGQLVEGKIVSIKPFGAFVEFDGSTGLLHIKQISQSFIESISAVFQIDQPIKAMIIDLDEGKGRISLSTRMLENYPGEMLEKMAEVMDSAQARAERAKQKLLQQ